MERPGGYVKCLDTQRRDLHHAVFFCREARNRKANDFFPEQKQRFGVIPKSFFVGEIDKLIGKQFKGIKGLEEEHKLFTMALDASISGIIITDNTLTDNPIIYCNKAFEHISGYSRQEIIGHNCRFLQGEDRDQSARQELRDAVRTGKSCKIEIRNYRKDGTLFWNELYMAPVLSDEGDVRYFIGVQNDVTKRKQAETEVERHKKLLESRVGERTRHLRDNQEFLNSIFQTIRESLLVLSPDLKVLSANDYFLNTFKVGVRETEGQLLYELGNGQWNIDALRKLLEEILPTNNPVLDFEVEHEFPQIGKKLMLLNAHRVELEGTFKNRILLAIEDITEKRSIQNRKDDFLSIASHELKTPLTTIKGMIQLIDKRVKDQQIEALAPMVDKTALHVGRLADLIDDLLDMSRIQSGNLEIHKDWVDFDALVTECVDLTAVALPSHKIQVTGEVGKKILVDESGITQVIRNLISNAIKYSPAGDRVDIELSGVSDFVKFSIRDYGLGIAREDQKHIFERFFRAGKLQKKFPGMGVGLYVSEQIITAHGGTLWVESEPDKGATFHFTLPTEKNESTHGK